MFPIKAFLSLIFSESSYSFMIRLSTSRQVRWNKLNKGRANKIIESFLPSLPIAKVESENKKTVQLHAKFSFTHETEKNDSSVSDNMSWFFNDPCQHYGMDIFNRPGVTMIHGLQWPMHLLRAMSLVELHKLWFVLQIVKKGQDT